jgi:acyl CoA:acetate/3-ketoacid CoA transferase
MITERGLFVLDDHGWLLTEVAVGVDPESHIAPVLGFPLRVSPNARRYERAVMAGPGQQFDEWLRAHLATPLECGGEG